MKTARCICLMLACAFGVTAAAAGTPPIEVCTAVDLDNVRNDLGGEYVQVCDIDLAGYAFEPIGSASAPFAGSYDGGERTISNLEYLNPTIVDNGLFGRVMMASISNVRMVNTVVSGFWNVGALIGHAHHSTISNSHAVGGNISAATKWVGGLIGHVHPGCTVTNCSADMTVSGQMMVGGFAGNHHGSVIDNCYALGTVSSTSNYTGGLVGYCQEDTFETALPTIILNSFAKGPVNGSMFTGGLVGYLERGSSINDSAAYGNVTAVVDYAGGLVGYSVDSAISDSLASGAAQARMRVGGLLGYAINSSITRSHANGPAHSMEEGASYSGGLVGYLHTNSTITDSYARGLVTAGGQYVGGLVGYQDGGTIARSYAAGDVEATERFLGGLVGRVTSAPENSIVDSYSTGEIRSLGPDGAVGGCGGLVGLFGAGTVEHGYAAGYILPTSGFDAGLVGFNNGGTVFGAYWDIDASGAPIGCGYGPCDGVFGEDTADMMIQSTFAGWDFVETWFIQEGQTYPLLQWQDTCPSDLNDSATVDAGDLAVLLGAWSTLGNDPADLNEDGIVNAADLSLMLGSWGPCP